MTLVVETADTIAYVRDMIVASLRSLWMPTRSWLQEATGVEALWSALLLLALAGLLYIPYLVVRAAIRHTLAYHRQPDLKAIWYGLLAYESCCLALSLATLAWQSNAVRLDIVVGLAATIVWVAWTNGALIYYDTMLQRERPAKAVINEILREAWWNVE